MALVSCGRNKPGKVDPAGIVVSVGVIAVMAALFLAEHDYNWTASFVGILGVAAMFIGAKSQ